jgi:hypothetical protein
MVKFRFKDVQGRLTAKPGLCIVSRPVVQEVAGLLESPQALQRERTKLQSKASRALGKPKKGPSLASMT